MAIETGRIIDNGTSQLMVIVARLPSIASTRALRPKWQPLEMRTQAPGRRSAGAAQWAGEARCEDRVSSAEGDVVLTPSPVEAIVFFSRSIANFR
jgi:hypothetical protein